MNIRFRRSARLLIFVVATVFGVAACGVTREGNSAAATITFGDGTKVNISDADINSMVDNIAASDEFVALAYGESVPSDLTAIITAQSVQVEAIEYALGQEGGSISTEQLDEAREQLLEQLRGALQSSGEEVTDSDAEAVADQLGSYFDLVARNAEAAEQLSERLSEGGEGVEVPCVRHILVETPEEAAEIMDELGNGADFAELAVERSTGPSGPSGGELGCADPSGFVVEFRDAVLAAEVGVPVTVKTEFGYHVLEVTGSEATPVDGFALLDAKLQETLEAATVEIDPSIGKWDPVVGDIVAVEG